MGANERQVGGTHYRAAPGVMQHWDLVVATGMGYFEGQVTRYVGRWRKKNGVEDLRKAVHYIDKLAEVYGIVSRWRSTGVPPVHVQRAELEAYVSAHKLSTLEEGVFDFMISWKTKRDLTIARGLVADLIALAENEAPKSVPLSDSNKHADRETQVKE